jgi:hypothetical protein
MGVSGILPHSTWCDESGLIRVCDWLGLGHGGCQVVPAVPVAAAWQLGAPWLCWCVSVQAAFVGLGRSMHRSSAPCSQAACAPGSPCLWCCRALGPELVCCVHRVVAPKHLVMPCVLLHCLCMALCYVLHLSNCCVALFEGQCILDMLQLLTACLARRQLTSPCIVCRQVVPATPCCGHCSTAGRLYMYNRVGCAWQGSQRQWVGVLSLPPLLSGRVAAADCSWCDWCLICD